MVWNACAASTVLQQQQQREHKIVRGGVVVPEKKGSKESTGDRQNISSLIILLVPRVGFQPRSPRCTLGLRYAMHMHLVETTYTLWRMPTLEAGAGGMREGTAAGRGGGAWYDATAEDRWAPSGVTSAIAFSQGDAYRRADFRH